MSSTIEIMNLGDDQMASQWALTFPEGIPGGGNADALTLRFDTSFDPPEDIVESYEVWHQGQKTMKTSMTHAMDKMFTIDYRVDQNFAVHNALEAWRFKCYDPINGTALPDIETRATGLLQLFDGQNKIVKQFRFRGLKPKGEKLQTLEMSSPDPLRSTITFIFNDYIPESA